jgi:exonuclease 3'-5' domain-containing protein 1
VNLLNSPHSSVPDRGSQYRYYQQLPHQDDSHSRTGETFLHQQLFLRLIFLKSPSTSTPTAVNASLGGTDYNTHSIDTIEPISAASSSQSVTGAVIAQEEELGSEIQAEVKRHDRYNEHLNSLSLYDSFRYNSEVHPRFPILSASTDHSKVTGRYRIQNRREVQFMMDELLVASQQDSVNIFFDLEGVDLGRHGQTTDMAIYDSTNDEAWLVDILALGVDAFTTYDVNRRLTLKMLLESKNTWKAAWDVRNDSDALFSGFGIRLASVLDVQLLEARIRLNQYPFENRRRAYDRAALEYSIMPQEYRTSWSNVKREGSALYKSSEGGSIRVWTRRPLPQALIEYMVGDVLRMNDVLEVLQEGLQKALADEVKRETARAVAETWSPNFNPRGSSDTKTRTPWFVEEVVEDRYLEAMLDGAPYPTMNAPTRMARLRSKQRAWVQWLKSKVDQQVQVFSSYLETLTERCTAILTSMRWKKPRDRSDEILMEAGEVQIWGFQEAEIWTGTGGESGWQSEATEAVEW